MRRNRFAPLALLILAAACTEDTTTIPSPTDQFDSPAPEAYQREIERSLQNSPSASVSPSSMSSLVAPPLDPVFLEDGEVEVVTNGSFETGDFTAWQTAMTGTPIFYGPWTVSGSGNGAPGFFGMASTDPQDGQFVAWNGFDAVGPMDFVLSQEVTLPPGEATLSWKERIQWNFGLVSGQKSARVHTVEIRDPDTDALLATVRSFETETTNEVHDTGWQDFEVDVSAFAGQTVTLVFRQHIPEMFTGPGQFEVDDVSLVVVEGDPTIAVELDIKPGSDENPVNLRSRGVLPVAILTTDAFDAADVDVSTVTLGDGDEDDTSVAARGRNPRRAARPHASVEDVDDDGDLDLALKFRTEDLVENDDLNDATTELFLNGATQDGTPIVGSDAVQIRGHSDHEDEEVSPEGGDKGSDDPEEDGDDEDGDDDD